MDTKQQPEALPALIERFRGLHFDHAPDGWPAVRMRDITALLDDLDNARSDNQVLRLGYAAARLEIESLKAQLHAAKQINAAQFGLLAASIPGSALRASHGQAPARPDQPIACSYGDNGYACCEGGPCQADVHNDKLAEQPAPAGAAPECLTCSDHGAVGNILTAEPCPDCTRWNVQPAPSGATEEVENLRKALVYAAFALHDTPQYMLAQGIALIDGDTVRVSRDGWTVEASVNPHRQPAPAAQPAQQQEAQEPVAVVVPCYTPSGKRVALYSAKQDLPIGTQLYTAPKPSTTAQAADSVPAVSDLPPLPAPDLRDVGTKPQEIKEFLKGYATEYARTAIAARATADSVQEDAARLDFLIDQVAYVVSDPDTRPGYWLHWARPDGSTWVQIDEYQTPRAAIDAARKQGEKQ